MNKKIKVLHVVGKRPLGGIGTFLYNLNKFVDHSKFSFDFLINGTDENGEFDEKVKVLGSNVYTLPKLDSQNFIFYLKELKSFYEKNHDYDIIHIHSVNIAIFNYILLKKYKGDHIIAVHSHSTKYSDKFFNSLRNRLLTLPLKYITDLFFACSDSAANSIFGRDIVEKKGVNIINNSIDTHQFRFDESIRREMRNKLNIDSQLVVGHVGAFTPVKNHDFIIDIFYELKKINNHAVLILIGTGQLEEKIRMKIKKLNLTKSVKLLGSRKDVNKLMQAFDVFLMPSKFEGVPLVGLEAQASGLPCVFSDTITEEIKLTHMVSYLDLNMPPQEWAYQILESYKSSNKSDAIATIKKAGYDIRGNVKELEEIYININC
jgi:glycosyltransferase involved in cell wall biosynthesis